MQSRSATHHPPLLSILESSYYDIQILNVLMSFRKSVKLPLPREPCGQTSKVEYQTIYENAYIGHGNKIISYNEKIDYWRPNENKKTVLLMTPC